MINQRSTKETLTSDLTGQNRAEDKKEKEEGNKKRSNTDTTLKQARSGDIFCSVEDLGHGEGEREGGGGGAPVEL